MVEEGDLWRHLPLELGFGGASTCYRRLDEWQRAGVWEWLHEQLLAELRAASETEWARAVADFSHLQTKKGLRDAPEPGRSKSGPSITFSSTRAGSRSPGPPPAATQRRKPVDPAPRARPARARQGRVPTAGAQRVTADRAYDRAKYRREFRRRRITPEIARRQTEHGLGSDGARRVVERTFAWLHDFKRPLVR